MMRSLCVNKRQKASSQGRTRLPTQFASDSEFIVIELFHPQETGLNVSRRRHPAAEKPRSVIVQILDRFAEARTKRTVAKRTLIDEKAAKVPRRKQSK